MTQELRLVVGCAPNTPDGHLDALLGLADEVFVGYVPHSWLARYGAEVSPNRRHAVDRQHLTRDALARVAERVVASGAALSVTLNEHHAPAGSEDLLGLIVDDALAVGATGFIVADLGALAFVRARAPAGTRLALSNEAGAYNVEAARAYVAAGATRIIFPRELRVGEMAAIATALRADAARDGHEAPELEAFVAREFCPNSSSICYATHGYGRSAHFCFAHDRQTIRAIPSGDAVGEVPRLPSGWSDDPALLSAIMTWHRCGLCAIDALAGLGVTHLKIPGRSGSALAAVRAIRELLAAGDLTAAACRATVANTAFCGGKHCYYDLEDVRRARALAPPRASASASASAPEPSTTSTPELTPAPAPALSAALLPESCTVEHLAALSAGGLAALARGSAPEPSTASVPEPTAAPAPALSTALLPESCTAEHLATLSAGGLAALARALPLTPWERAAADRTLPFLTAQGLATGGAPARVVLDLSACPLRWPKPRALVELLQDIADAGFPLALALPVAFEAHVSDLIAGLTAVAPLRPTVLANDLGALALASGLGLPVETGRVLNRMKRDQLGRDPTALPAPMPPELLEPPALDALRLAQDRAYGAPYLDRGVHAAHLRAAGVRRLAWDTLPTPLSAPPSDAFEASLWAPWSYLTSSRACPLAVALEGASPAHPTTRCRRPCVTRALDVSFPYPHAPTIRHGATAALDLSEELPAFYASASGAFSEVVVALEVPR